MKATQSERILNHLREHGSITALVAIETYGIMRLASRISSLRKQGHPISSKVESVKNRFGENCYIKRYIWEGGDADDRDRAEGAL